MPATRDDLSDHVRPAFDKYVAEHGEPGLVSHNHNTVVIWDKSTDEEPLKIYDLETLQEISGKEAIKRGVHVSRSKAMKPFLSFL